jgi:hypothetical protein
MLYQLSYVRVQPHSTAASIEGFEGRRPQARKFFHTAGISQDMGNSRTDRKSALWGRSKLAKTRS